MNNPKPETVVQIPLTKLHPFPDHPFKVQDDEAMQELVQSIKACGVLFPVIVRPCGDESYEIISGHRRKRACELARIKSMPAVIRNIDKDTATIFMVDSNLQRENLLPSERAQAYKMKLEAMKRRSGRHSKSTLKNSPKFSANFRSDDEIGSSFGVSGDTLRNYISLTQLLPELQRMVDAKKIALTPAYQIAGLKQEEQAMLLETIESEQITPSLSQAQRMRKLSQSGWLNEDTMRKIMTERKTLENNDVILSVERLRKYFPGSCTPRQIAEAIFELLDHVMGKRV